MAQISKLNSEDIENYKAKLLKIRNSLLEDVNHLENGSLHKSPREASGDLSTMPHHMADVASDSYDQEFNISLMETEGEELREIDAALERIENGSYGVCDSCEKSIPKKRLNVIPYTRLCIKCKQNQESTRG